MLVTPTLHSIINKAFQEIASLTCEIEALLDPSDLPLAISLEREASLHTYLIEVAV